eukprot:GHVN01046166.1.p1 GENE.GHVN01046166.1~~GHVN01046166.1.p1  ORF type:complete len:231 (+),score=19.57 GHVN01046166.1:2-694(+)
MFGHNWNAGNPQAFLSQPAQPRSFQITPQNEIAYPPTMKLSSIPSTEQIKYENKNKQLEGNKEKIALIKRRNTGLFNDIEKRIEVAREKHGRILTQKEIQKGQYETLKKDDMVAWDSVEETSKFCEKIKRNELPLVDPFFDYIEYILLKHKVQLQEIEEKTAEIERTISLHQRERITQKTISNILHAQHETYDSILQKYFRIIEQISEQKEIYRQKRREKYSDYLDPFTN